MIILQMLASIFQQLGGQGHVPGFMAGDGGNASGVLAECLHTSSSFCGVHFTLPRHIVWSASFCGVHLTLSRHIVSPTSVSHVNVEGDRQQRQGQEAQFITQQVNLFVVVTK